MSKPDNVHVLKGYPEYSPGEIQSRLDCLDPDMDEHDWIIILAAVQSWDSLSGYDIAKEWSAQGKKYQENKFNSHWKSLKPDGLITVGTLIKLSNDAGFKANTATKQDRPVKPYQKTETAPVQADKGHVIELCKRILTTAQECTEHPYLTAKRVKPCPGLKVIHSEIVQQLRGYFGQEMKPGTWLILPMEINGELFGLQAIDEDGNKGFIKGSTKGLFLIGAIEGGRPVCIVEGLATGVTVYESTGYAVVVAFDCGNLKKTAEEIRKQDPTGKIILCGDRGNGEDKARKAADAVGGMVVIPDMDSEGTDFNDLAKDHGLDEVKRQIDKALQESELNILSEYIDVSSLDTMTFSKTWLVENMIEQGRAYEWFGAWKSGKTLVVIDLCCHSALSRTWADRRTVQSLVVWVAGESCEDVKRRIAAWRIRHNIKEPMPFFIRTKPVHINDQRYAQLLRDEIEVLKTKYPSLPVLLVVDTVARSLSPDCDENSIQGLGAFANHIIDEVVRPTGCSAICVHHSGHGDKDRSRGWSGFAAAMDGSVQISMDKNQAGPSIIKVNTTRSRSTAGNDAIEFRVDIQEIPGTDNFGSQMEEPVLFYRGEIKQEPKEPGGINQQKLLALFEKYPGGVLKQVLKADWLESGGDLKRFSEALKGLVKNGFIQEHGLTLLPGGSSENPNFRIPKGNSDNSDSTDNENSTLPENPKTINSDNSDNSDGFEITI
jgi:phage/plasmid primase-like uncharacterized protein